MRSDKYRVESFSLGILCVTCLTEGERQGQTFMITLPTTDPSVEEFKVGSEIEIITEGDAVVRFIT